MVTARLDMDLGHPVAKAPGLGDQNAKLVNFQHPPLPHGEGNLILPYPPAQARSGPGDQAPLFKDECRPEAVLTEGRKRVLSATAAFPKLRIYRLVRQGRKNMILR